jgi:hypothetical protein
MKTILRLLSISLLGLLIVFPIQASPIKGFNEIILKIDTLQFRYPSNMISIQGENYLPVFYQNESEICEINIYPSQINSRIRLLPSPDFEIIDTLLLINQQYYRAKIKFFNLNRSQFLNLTFQIKSPDTENFILEELKLFPHTKTTVNFYPSSDELYIGEEKIFELLSNNSSNIKITNEWTIGNDINYRISEHNGQIRVHLLPTSLGIKILNLNIQTKSPYIDANKNFHYECPVISQTFKVKSSRMAFLNLDKREVTFDDDIRKTGIEITLDNNKNLQLNKTYRIEDQEKPGGPLIAEIFTKNNLANDKVLCLLRAYNMHRQTEGYLYIKDGDEAKFITNISITPKTTITNIQIMRNGQEWTTNTSVFPGETVDVKIEGEGLHKAQFNWEDIKNITPDTINRNDNNYIFKLQIPMGINKRKISLFNQTLNTGFSLSVKEYQIPRPFDFISLNFGNSHRILSNMPPTVIQRKTIPDIILSFDNAKIDADNKLYGRQYLDIDIKLVGKKGELIEMKTLKNVLVCPADNSPRSAYYKDKNTTNADISLNSQLSNKTYNIEDFSKIAIAVSNPADKYNESSNEKKVEIVIQHAVVFDIDVSFPAGLMVQNLGRTQTEQDALNTYNSDYSAYKLEYNAYLKELELWTNNPVGTKPAFDLTEPVKPKKAAFTDNLGGISLALIAQFSFPDAQKVGYLKPYKLGAGFLAINAFNFSESASRDLAAVVLASLYPIKPGKIFNLPIHLGFGYKFQDKIPFIMLSPGIGIKF